MRVRLLADPAAVAFDAVEAIRDELGGSVKLVGVGETPDDVEPFDAESFIDAMFDPD